VGEFGFVPELALTLENQNQFFENAKRGAVRVGIFCYRDERWAVTESGSDERDISDQN
jgi:hypothetical protein